MPKPAVAAVRPVDELLGDIHPLADQLGSADGLVTLNTAAESLKLRRIDSLAALRRFLVEYQSQLLLPLELPTIRRAFSHAASQEARELIELDCSLSAEPMLKEFAAASGRVGQAQLRRLRPLRDERVVQRYLRAIDLGAAHGWHTVVYGMTLALYSLPLRQGLQNYADQTLRSFVRSATCRLNLNESKGRELLDELLRNLGAPLDALVMANPLCRFPC